MLRLSQIKLAFRNEGLLVLVTCFSTDSFQIPCHFNCLMFQRRFFVHFESSGLGAITSLDSLGAHPRRFSKVVARRRACASQGTRRVASTSAFPEVWRIIPQRGSLTGSCCTRRKKRSRKRFEFLWNRGWGWRWDWVCKKNALAMVVWLCYLSNLPWRMKGNHKDLVVLLYNIPAQAKSRGF